MQEKAIVFACEELYSSLVTKRLTSTRPIMSYLSQGCTKNGVHARDHAVIHTSDYPSYLPGEERLMDLRPIKVKQYSPRDRLDPTSRLNYAKVYTIEYNVTVRFIGEVHGDSADVFIDSYNSIHPRLSESVPPVPVISNPENSTILTPEYSQVAYAEGERIEELRKPLFRRHTDSSSPSATPGLFGMDSSGNDVETDLTAHRDILGPNDSGYGSVPGVIARKNEPDDDTQSIRSILTNAPRVRLPPEEEENLISAFAGDLCQDIGFTGDLDGAFDRMTTRLPDLLKSFAVRLEGACLSQEERDAKEFVRQQRK
jgi:hypothetical protein